MLSSEKFKNVSIQKTSVMSYSKRLYIVLILCWFISQGILCEHVGGTDNCSNYKIDTVSLSFRVVNPSVTYHLHDTIKLFSKISDTINSRSGESFITPVNVVFAYIQSYKVVPSGSGYGINYANNEFNYIADTGTFQNIGLPGYDILYDRNEPYNTAALSVIPGNSGLYVFTVWLQNESYGGAEDFFKGNDRCIAYRGIPTIAMPGQNGQYWDSLGVSSLALINSGAVPVNKTDENYFFVKVAQ